MAEPRAGDEPEIAAPGAETSAGAGRLSHAEMEAAALEGRQVGGELGLEAALRLLRDGRLDVVARLLEASNATFYCLVEDDGESGSAGAVASCVYKPVRGERPLFDFPDGTLACREVAAFAVSEASGWRIVPPTVIRDGPLGRGMVQLWIEADPSADPVRLIDDDLPALRRIALFDAILNNADRKGGHLLPLRDGRVLAIDNGLSFAVEPKLRTILWRWRGQPLEPAEMDVLERLREAMAANLGEELRALLQPREVRATLRRIEGLLSRRRFPLPDRDRPVLPWPPF
jgi:hypothetical protein